MIFIALTIFGIVIGSFLNVVIGRYPIMLKQSWRAECREFLQLPAEPPGHTFNLAIPRSRCPQCRHQLAAWQLIPLVSYLILRGHCEFCRQRISLQYPLVEFITAITTVAVFIKFGWQLPVAPAWLLTWGLIVLSGIDWKTQLLPDNITLSLLWIGLLVNTVTVFTPLSDAVMGASAGYILLWGVAHVFKFIRKKPGMGHGDFKMLAMLGAWLGLSAMLHLLLLAIALSLIVNLCLLLGKKIAFNQPLPFGPWLAIAGWLVLMFDTQAMAWLSNMAGS